MTEGPILMTPENAQKCFDGVKTQTRRIVKEHQPYLYVEPHYDERGAVVLRIDPDTGSYAEYWPYGVVGDRLWIREAVCEYDLKGYGKGILYKGSCPSADLYQSLKPVFKPAIHMPRRLCRTVVELTDIKVCRVQEITPEDARAEGSYLDRCACQHMQRAHDTTPLQRAFTQTWCREHGQEFKDMWDSIYGPGAWERNEFVWALTFRRIES